MASSSIDSNLDLAQMEIESGRLRDARLRFTKMSRTEREMPRALYLRARASETASSRRLVAGFVRSALIEHTDPESKCYLSAALAFCGDRAEAERQLPAERHLTESQLRIRKIALDAMGAVPTLPEEEVLTFGEMLFRKLLPSRRAR